MVTPLDDENVYREFALVAGVSYCRSRRQRHINSADRAAPQVNIGGSSSCCASSR